jgi:hypothetical protein
MTGVFLLRGTEPGLSDSTYKATFFRGGTLFLF